MRPMREAIRLKGAWGRCVLKHGSPANSGEPLHVQTRGGSGWSNPPNFGLSELQMGLVLADKAFHGCGLRSPAAASGFLTPWAVTRIIKHLHSCHRGGVVTFLVGDLSHARSVQNLHLFGRHSTVSPTAGWRYELVGGPCAKRSGSGECGGDVCSGAGAQQTPKSRCTSERAADPEVRIRPKWPIRAFGAPEGPGVAY